MRTKDGRRPDAFTLSNTIRRVKRRVRLRSKTLHSRRRLDRSLQ